MNDWFASLEARERLFVVSGAVVVVIALFWFALWAPLDRGEDNLQARIESWRSSLVALRPLRGRLQNSGVQPVAATGNQSLVVIVDNTLRTRNLYGALQRSQPTTNDGIRVEFENVAFDDVMLWLGELGAQFALHVESASFSNNSGSNAGRVNASITLER